MHDVVEMLLTRIKDYPEDFVREPSPKNLYEESGKLGKWYAALRTAQEVMTEEEKVVINDALEMAKRAVYMGAALKTILSDEVPEETQKQQYYEPAIGQALTDTRGIITSAVFRNQASQVLSHAIRDEYN